ncbi:bifunctional polysaccharide deacetylase/glycosyltransferase family 2 protein [Streptomyces ochraceiscleroticus]|uniref:Bifunctional polysaccharide deacetylase/glycosyltransferase family 2 protein n=1 Tax=Streptomyces ochraceiscleroticus TaxID=47761 RepID=A0ABW1MNY0_9ACTN|nr:bifunctional polysaccharide deacetylase/glycosyltransferase family 2 protein [Streptomyces ochraceiscleroticus]
MLNGHMHAHLKIDPKANKAGAWDLVPTSIRQGGPVIDQEHGKLASRSLPPKTVVLSFDDGPDPSWTPKVLEVLRRHHVRADFFLIGQNIARHPSVVRTMVDQGHEVGVHTFSHANLGFTSHASIDQELSTTQSALAGAAGVTTSLIRTPYSSGPDAIDNRSFPVLKYLSSKGYTTAYVDANSNDWKKPGVEKIVRNATPQGNKGALTLFHDAGGDRSESVKGVDAYITHMKAKGYRFTTISAAMGSGSAMHDATGMTSWKGRAMLTVTAVAIWTAPWLAYLFYVVGGMVVLRFVMMLVLAGRHHRQRNPKRSRGEFSWGPPVTEPVSVLVPAYNEKECIAHTVRSLTASTHPIEVIVIDDGSTDGTADIVEALGLPNVRVLRQRNAGKSAALNNGIVHARHDIIVMMDGDTVFEPSTVSELVQPFANAHIGAVSGNAKVGNRRSLIGAWQHIEYVMSFNLDRRMYDVLDCIPTIPGAVGAFRRRALEEVGGMSGDTLAEDTDVTIAMHRAGWRVVYQEHAVAWTEAPSSFRLLWRQRYRWSYGTMQALWKHRRSVVEHGASGRFGRVGMPLVGIFHVGAPLLSPVIDVFTLYGMIFLSPWKSLAVWCLLLLFQLLCAAYAFRLDRERYRCLVMLPLQQVVYRQLMYMVLIHSCITAATGARLRWQKIRRTGEVVAPSPNSSAVVSAGGRRAARAATPGAVPRSQSVTPGHGQEPPVAPPVTIGRCVPRTTPEIGE